MGVTDRFGGAGRPLTRKSNGYRLAPMGNFFWSANGAIEYGTQVENAFVDAGAGDGEGTVEGCSKSRADWGLVLWNDYA